MFEKVINEKSSSLIDTKLEAKIDDYKDLLQKVNSHNNNKIEIHLSQDRHILIADYILPSFIEKIIDSGVCGIILKELSIYSHSAILLKEANIPTLISNITNPNQEIILDALSGVIVPNPNSQDLIIAKNREEEFNKNKNISFNHRFDKATTKTNKEIKVLANIGDLNSAKIAKKMVLMV